MYRLSTLALALTTAIIVTSTSGFAQTAVTQNSNNTGPVTGTVGDSVTINTNNNITALGASLSVNTTGASSTVNVTGIVVDFAAPAGGFANVAQAATNNGQITTPGGTIDLGGVVGNNNVQGNGISVSVRATGAISAFAITGISGTAPFSSVSVGNVSQVSNTGTGGVTNVGTLANISQVTGHGVSLSISSTGAVTAVSSTFIASQFSGPSFGNIQQTTDSASAVTNTNNGFIIGVGLDGDGSSASASAAGAVSSISVTSILNTAAPGTPPSINKATQDTGNTGAVINNGGTISSATLTGVGSSISVSAVGALSVLSVTSIADTGSLAGASIGPVNQISLNAGAPITNTGSIIIDSSLTGNGASASVSALGAGTAVSFVAINR